MSEIAVPPAPPLISLHGECDWQLPLSLFESANLLKVLSMHNRGSIKRLILRRLQITDAMKKLDPDQLKALEDDELLDLYKIDPKDPDKKARKAANRRRMLKGLAMELICASIIRHLDTPLKVTALAQPRDGKPNSLAPPGEADISADYPKIPQSPKILQSRDIKVIAEVTAKRKVTTENFLTQLRQGYKHAVEERKKAPDSLIYCLLVNGARIHTDVRLHELYRGYLQQKELTPDGDIRIVPMYSKDFSFIAGMLSDRYGLDELYFEPEVLFDALDAVCRGFAEEELPEKRMWVIHEFMGVIIEYMRNRPPGPGGELTLG